jgi:hypothetical protein
MSDAVLDDPGFLAARERFWTAALTDERGFARADHCDHIHWGMDA